MTIIKKHDELTDEDFKRLGKYVHKNYGINLYPNKKILVSSRLLKRLVSTNMSTYSEYCDFVLNTEDGKKEIIEMMNALSTNKTDFFRENDHFTNLIEKILPSYVSEHKKNYIRIWSAGCSSGEEAYSLAMVLQNYREKHQYFDFSIVATDISTRVLKKAILAIYPEKDTVDIPPYFKKKYLLRSKDRSKKQVRIISDIRKKVTFVRNNLVRDSLPSSTMFDIVFCRNTIIYFDAKTQKVVIDKILNNITLGGYLFLGHSESLINSGLNIRHSLPSIYQKSKNL